MCYEAAILWSMYPHCPCHAINHVMSSIISFSGQRIQENINFLLTCSMPISEYSRLFGDPCVAWETRLQALQYAWLHKPFSLAYEVTQIEHHFLETIPTATTAAPSTLASTPLSRNSFQIGNTLKCTPCGFLMPPLPLLWSGSDQSDCPGWIRRWLRERSKQNM